MQSVILAGGRGTRLRPLTYEVPKPMVPVNGRPFLEHQLGLLRAFGITDVLFLVGYLGEKIERYFGNGSRQGMKIEYSYEKELLGTGGAIRNARDKVAGEFLLLNGDTYLPLDYSNLIEHFHRFGKSGIIAVYDNSDGIAANNVSLADDGLVASYDKDESDGMTHVDAGVMLFNKTVLELIPRGRCCSLEREIFEKLIRAGEFAAYVTGQRFYDIGSVEGLEVIKGVLE